MRTARTVSSASIGRRQEVEIDRGRLLRVGRHDVDVPPALRPHRMRVAGHAGLAGDARPLRARLGQHRHPAQQQVGRLEPFARADEGADRRADHGQQAVAEQRVAQGLLHQAEPAAAIVEGDAFGADRPSACAARSGRAGSRRRPAGRGAPRCRATRRRSGWPMPDSSSSCGELIDAGADHDLARGTRLARDAADRVADADAALAVEQQRLGQGIGLDAQVGAAADGIEVAARPCSSAGARRSSPGSWRCRPAARRCSRDCAGCRPGPPPRSGPRTADRAQFGIGDAQRAVAAAKGVVALAFVASMLLEEGQHVARSSSRGCPSAPRCRSPAPGRARRPGR